MPKSFIIARINYPIKYIHLSLLLTFALVNLLPPVSAQKNYDPNLGHFYMGRQQWTVEDNSPIINDRTSTTDNTMNGSLPSRPVPLPKSGWQGYAPIEKPPANPNPSKNSNQLKSSTSKNSASGNKGKAGNLTGNKSPSSIKGYKPYATYQNPVANPAEPQTSTHVKGNLLHWARRGSKPE